MVKRLQNLCTAVVRSLPASGAGVVLMVDGAPAGVAASSDATSGAMEEFQFTLGEGPCLEAYHSGRPALEPDLSGSGRRRWPGYAAAAVEHDVGAAFAFPLQIGAERFGVLDVYRAEAGSLSDRTLSLALTFGQVAVGIILDGQDGVAAGDVDPDVANALAYRTEVYQAQGMLMIQLHGTLADAISRLRAHAFAHDRSINEVATDVLAGNLRFTRDNA